jgi:hypothetical protein
MKICTHCKAGIADEAVICVKCGHPVVKKNYVVKIVVSLVVVAAIGTIVGIKLVNSAYDSVAEAVHAANRDNAAKLQQSLGGLYVPGLSEDINKTLGNSATTRSSRPSIPAHWKQAGDFYYILQKDESMYLVEYTGESSEVVIPAEINGMPVKKIGSLFDRDYATQNKVTSVVIPDGVTRIDNWAFRDCARLASVTIPDSVTSLGDNGAFLRCTRLASITIPGSVTTICTYTFSDCKNLASVTMLDGVTTIEIGAFSHCTSLTSVTIPGSVTSLSGFSDCTSLASIDIPDGVTSIGSMAFKRCTSLTSVTIPDSVTKISESAFEGCTSLVTVTISPVERDYLNSKAFKKCPKLSRESKAAIKAAGKMAGRNK